MSELEELMSIERSAYNKWSPAFDTLMDINDKIGRLNMIKSFFKHGSKLRELRRTERRYYKAYIRAGQKLGMYKLENGLL